MKLSEILTESQTLNEAPMGMLKRGALGLASKFSSKATGKLAAGNEANALRKDFDFWLGSTNQEPTAQTLLQFLNKEGLPTQNARNLISKIPGGSRNPNVIVPKNIIDQIMTSIAASELMPKQGQTQAATSGAQPAATNTPPGGAKAVRNPQTAPAAQSQAAPQAANFKQVKPTIDKLSDRDKQELIDYLKKNDRFQKLKF